MKKLLAIVFSLLLTTSVFAQNPPTAYTPQTTPYTGTESWYCERVTGTLNGRCSVADLFTSMVTLNALISAPNLTTVGLITTGGLGAGAQITLGSLTYSGTHGLPDNQLSNNYTLPLATAQGGTGVATPDLIAGNGISLAGSWPNKTITAKTGASFQGAASNPAGTTSASGVMAGIGATCTITPNKTGTVFFSIYGTASDNTINGGCGMVVRTGTGTAPSNGAAPSGTVISATGFSSGLPAASSVVITGNGVQNGLALGTAVWFDFVESATSGVGTCTYQNVSCSAMEQ